MKLLDLQEVDSRIDVLSHQMASLPEIAAIAETAAEHQQVDTEVRDLRISVADLTEEQAAADADVEAVRSRQRRDQGMVDAGTITDPKALQRMLGELESLQRRIGDLEDVELDVMERLEAAQSSLAERETVLAELARRGQLLTAQRDAKLAELQREQDDLRAERNVLASGIPADLVALYERIRGQKGGVGAAALRARECGGCRLSLNPSDLAVIAKAPVDDVVRCEECQRILVRTAESGL